MANPQVLLGAVGEEEFEISIDRPKEPHEIFYRVEKDEEFKEVIPDLLSYVSFETPDDFASQYLIDAFRSLTLQSVTKYHSATEMPWFDHYCQLGGTDPVQQWVIPIVDDTITTYQDTSTVIAEMKSEMVNHSKSRRATLKLTPQKYYESRNRYKTVGATTSTVRDVTTPDIDRQDYTIEVLGLYSTKIPTNRGYAHLRKADGDVSVTFNKLTRDGKIIGEDHRRIVRGEPLSIKGFAVIPIGQKFNSRVKSVLFVPEKSPQLHIDRLRYNVITYTDPNDFKEKFKPIYRRKQCVVIFLKHRPKYTTSVDSSCDS